MCGLVGKTNNNIPVDRFNDSLDYLKKRGPDSHGVWVDKFVTLGHTRLSIRDVSNFGNQPMESKDNRYVIIFNGEIYNIDELKYILENKNIILEGNSDTEVICNLYPIIGDDIFSRLDGMYAIVIYDKLENKLIFARDPYGIKPLYLYNNINGLSFASEVKALCILNELYNQISIEELEIFNFFGHIANHSSIINGVFECKPGELIKYDVKNSQMERKFFSNILKYWNSDSLYLKSDQAPMKLEDSIINSLKRHLIADVPVCLFLSAGLDSAIIAAAAYKLGHKLECITIGFEKYRNTLQDEVPLAIQIAKKYGFRHHIKYFTQQELDSLFDSFVLSMDQPTVDGFNTWLISNFAKSIGFKVALSGAGADELFNGYSHINLVRMIYRFRYLINLAPVKSLEQLFGKFLNHKYKKLIKLLLNSNSLSAMLDYFRCYSLVNLPHSYSDRDYDLWGNKPKGNSEIAKFCSYYESTNYLRFRLLRDSDWASMAHGVEIRLPYVDRKFLSEISVGLNKYAIKSKKHNFSGLANFNLPFELFSKKKTGFNVPFVGFKMSSLDNHYQQRMLYKNNLLIKYLEFFDYKNEEIINSD